MITIKQHNTTELTGLGILRDLDSFSLQDISEAIEDLETNIGAPGTGKKYFGDVWNEKLQVLYSLKNFSSKKSLNDEIRDLKEAPINKFTRMYGQTILDFKSLYFWGQITMSGLLVQSRNIDIHLYELIGKIEVQTKESVTF
ncbi:hypothetical protein GYN67_03180 [Lactococcus piscium]|uniref:hypothetical protein n=1 Tax=Pseudolactococcus carnosus TaxID=2749961 RepID=UPI001FB889DD|nr:hypothetical protein [Lactococcus carnosus]MCJ1995698.1 hypothetical protein [Lactococcus carnosus]